MIDLKCTSLFSVVKDFFNWWTLGYYKPYPKPSYHYSFTCTWRDCQICMLPILLNWKLKRILRSRILFVFLVILSFKLWITSFYLWLFADFHNLYGNFTLAKFLYGFKKPVFLGFYHHNIPGWTTYFIPLWSDGLLLTHLLLFLLIRYGPTTRPKRQT